MIYTVEELQKAVFPRIHEVYEIFKNHFGENYVDLQDMPGVNNLLAPSTSADSLATTEISDERIKDLQELWKSVVATIMVYWPRVTVTNENGRSIEIYDLYAKVPVNAEGRMPYEAHGFHMKRATYTWEQFQSDYSHSHLSGIESDDMSRFSRPCLGTGPINNTILSLKNNYDEAFWMLFCQELSMYVTVESLSGGPYRKLEEVGRRGRAVHNEYTLSRKNGSSNYRTFKTMFTSDCRRKFLEYYLQHGHLVLKYAGGRYQPGIPYHQFMLDISNAFIDFYNQLSAGERFHIEDLTGRYVINKCVLVQGKFRSMDASDYLRTDDISGRHVCVFKGQEVRCTVLPECEETSSQPIFLLNHNIAMSILDSILRVINYRYKNERNARQNADGEESSPATHQKILYL